MFIPRYHLALWPTRGLIFMTLTCIKTPPKKPHKELSLASCTVHYWNSICFLNRNKYKSCVYIAVFSFLSHWFIYCIKLQDPLSLFPSINHILLNFKIKKKKAIKIFKKLKWLKKKKHRIFNPTPYLLNENIQVIHLPIKFREILVCKTKWQLNSQWNMYNCLTSSLMLQL